MLKSIMKELAGHIPFTLSGAAIGIGIGVALVRFISPSTAESIFYVLHPTHVVLSAMVTSAMFKMNVHSSRMQNNFWLLLLIGYLGAIGISTLSDSLIPYLAEYILQLPQRAAHIGFIEKWWLINPAAMAGVLIAYYSPTTHAPHSVHVLISTGASLFHTLMAITGTLSWTAYATIMVFLFLAVWIPCCVSDIVFPLFAAKQLDQYVHQHGE